MPTAVLSTSSSGNTTLISSIAAGGMVIDGITLVCTGAVGVKFLKGSTSLTGVMPFPANGGMVNIDCGFACAFAEDFKINLDGSVLVTGWVKYRTL